MPSESAKLFRLVSIEYEASAAATFTLSTDLPGEVLAVRHTETLPTTSGRQVYKFVLSGAVKGSIIRVRLTPNLSGSLTVYRVGLYVRRLGRQASDWQWYYLKDIVPTEDWVAVKVPIPPTPDEYTPVKVPVPPTPDEYAAVKVPIPPTPAEFSTVKIPMEQSSEMSQWIDFPMDEDQPTHRAA
jgi:hypothetical protein